MQEDIQLKKLLKAVAQTMNLIHWVGAYAYGRTSNGDPFIFLFSNNPKMMHKICRVYEGDFKKLPAFMNTNVPKNQPNSKNTPDRAELESGGNMKKCPAFQIVCYEGENTQMGKERRFSDVLYIPQATQE